MPDISMCMNVDCKDHDKCYRFLAEPSMRQSYMDFKPNEDGVCEHFWPIEEII